MDSMGALWTCPECETINDGQEKCVVCGMTYEKAKELYENQKMCRYACRGAHACFIERLRRKKCGYPVYLFDLEHDQGGNHCHIRREQ